MAKSDPALRLMLMSKTSFDKDATLNTLLEKEEIDISPTPQNKVEEYTNEAKTLTIVDTPGLMDVADPSSVKSTIETYRKSSISMWKKETQLDAIGLVFRYPVRMTPEESSSIKTLLDVVGEKKFKKYGILIFTNGASFTKHKNQKDADSEFKNYLKKEVEQATSLRGGESAKGNNAHVHLGTLIEWLRIGNNEDTARCMYIDNDDDAKCKHYIQKVTELIKVMQEANKRDRYKGKFP